MTSNSGHICAVYGGPGILVAPTTSRTVGMSISETTARLAVGHPTQYAARRSAAILAVALGIFGSVAGLLLGIDAGAVLVPFALGLVVAAAIAPFPDADVLLAFLMGGTMPTLPPSDLANVPLALPVVFIGLVRVLPVAWQRMPRRAALILLALWGTLALGMTLSAWPAPSLWLKPAAVVAVAALASILGLAVTTDRERTRRWLTGFGALGALVGATALAFYALQFVVPLHDLVDSMAELQRYVRGESAGEFFATVNNWVIWSPAGGIVRAVSVFVPAPHAVGGYMGLILPFFAAVALSRRAMAGLGQGERRAVAIILVIGYATLLLTLSRASWLAATIAGLAALLVLVFYARVPDWRRRVGWLIAGALVVTAVAAGTVAMSGQRAAGVAERVTNVESDDSASERVESDRVAVEGVVNNPLRGYGLGGWAVGVERPGASYVHNVYLEYARALGLAGLLWAMMIPVLLLSSGIALLKSWTLDGMLGVAFLTTGVFAAVHFMFDDSFLVPQYAWLLLFGVGAAVGLAAQATRPTSAETV